jgi:hypothetical protein
VFHPSLHLLIEILLDPAKCGDVVIRLRAGRSGVPIHRGTRDVPLIQKSIPAVGPTQPPIQWETGSIRGLNQPDRQVDHSAQYSTEIKMSGAVPLLPLFSILPTPVFPLLPLHGADKNKLNLFLLCKVPIILPDFIYNGPIIFFFLKFCNIQLKKISFGR